MSREFTKEEVIANKKDAIRTLNNMLESFINDPSGAHLKKANLLSYWIKDYVQMVQFEERFDPTKNIAYKRGNVVKINFGFNIGNEYGGLHYGVVLDKNNAHSSPVVTVIPLTSIKDGKAVHPNNVVLGNDLYRMMKLKYDTAAKSLEADIKDVNNAIFAISALTELVEKSLEKYNAFEDDNDRLAEKQCTEKYLETISKLHEIYDEKAVQNEVHKELLQKIRLEISHMKEGSVALINQITTVSKIRIFDPRNSGGALAGISLSKENMEKINQKVRDLYIFE